VKVSEPEPSLAYTTSIDAMFVSSRDPSNHFKDMRSSSKPLMRTKSQKCKYNDYKIVKPGQISQPHYAAPKDQTWGFWPTYPADLSTCEVVTLNKQQLYEDAQLTVPYYKCSSVCSCCRGDKFSRRAAERHETLARAEAYNWNKFGLHKDFPGQKFWDCTVYDELAWCDVEDYYDEEWVCECGAWELAHGTCGVEALGGREGDEPRVVYDLGTLVDNAIAGLGMPIKEPGWEDLAAACWDSPELDWVCEEVDVPEEEEFEWI
jgi:hypothetical protein